MGSCAAATAAAVVAEIHPMVAATKYILREAKIRNGPCAIHNSTCFVSTHFQTPLAPTHTHSPPTPPPHLPCSVCFTFLSYLFCVAWLLVFAPHQKQQENWFFCLSLFLPSVRLCFCTFNEIFDWRNHGHGTPRTVSVNTHNDSTHPADDEMRFGVAGIPVYRMLNNISPTPESQTLRTMM